MRYVVLLLLCLLLSGCSQLQFVAGSEYADRGLEMASEHFANLSAQGLEATVEALFGEKISISAEGRRELMQKLYDLGREALDKVLPDDAALPVKRRDYVTDAHPCET